MSISIRNLMKKQQPESLIRGTVPRRTAMTGAQEKKKNERIYRKTSRMAGGQVL